MLIHSVDINRFGIVNNAHLDFGPGINLITGDNGMGKSNVLKAIALMLIDYKGKAPKYENLVNWNAEGFELQMSLEHLQKRFEFDYRFFGSFTPIVTIDGEEFSGSSAKTELAKYFNPALCRASIISFQGSLDLVDSTPASRLENLKRIYDLDFSKEAKEIDEEVKSLKDKQIKTLEIEIANLEKKEYEYLPLVRLPWNEGVQEEYVARLNELLSVKGTYEALEQESKELKEKVRAGEITVLGLTRKVEDARLELSEAEGIVFEKRNDIEDQIKTIESKVYDEYLKSLEEDLSKITLQRPPSGISQDEIDDTTDRLNEAKFELKTQTQKIEALESGVCPTCGKEHSSEDLEEDRTQEKILTLRVSELQKELDTLYEKDLKQREVKEENDKKIQQKKELESKIESERKQIALSQERDQEKLTNLRERIKSNEEKMKVLKLTIQHEEEELRKANSELNTLKDKWEKVKEKLEAKEDNDSEIQDLENKVETYRNTEQRNLFIKEQNDKLKKQEAQDKKTLAKLKSEHSEKMTYLDRLIRGSQILKKEFPNYVVSQMKSYIEDGINDLVGSVYDGRYVVELQETKSGIEVVYGKGKAPIAISGGFEQELFNLGYKSAFSQIADLGVIFLDEVDSYASESNSHKLFESLIDTLNSKYEQVFIVTHKMAVQEMLITQGARAFEFNLGNVERVA